MESALPLDQILVGDCTAVLSDLPAESVDLVFADPPYNLQLHQPLLRPNQTRVAGVDDDWDQFPDLTAYDVFTRAWLAACRRVLKPTGTLWVIGTYHNIFRVGAILQDLNFWVLNTVAWIKTNPTPNFRGVRFTNAHEILIWAQKWRGQRYTFHHHAMKSLNDGLQMRSDWTIPTCSGSERLKVDGVRAHSTQKPEALLYRVLLSSSSPGDVVLDPFFGTGTTGAVARKLGRRWIGIERNPAYAELAHHRIQDVQPALPETLTTNNPRQLPRVPFGALLEQGQLQPGQVLYLGPHAELSAIVQADASVVCCGQRGSIHQVARSLSPRTANGWTAWYYRDGDGSLQPIDRLRQALRASMIPSPEDETV